MATRTRRAPGGRPARTLATLFALILALFVAIGASAAFGNPAGQWAPKLGLDLEGGRQIVLQPSVGKGQKITSGELAQAVDRIRLRVNGNGVTEAQVTTLGSGIEVSLPGNPSQQTLSALSQSSQLFFRAAIASATDVPPRFELPTPYTAPPATPAPKTSPTPSPSATTPSVKPSVSTPSPSKSSSPKSSTSKTSGTTANDVLPQAFRAAASKPGASSTEWETRPVGNIWISNGLMTKGQTYNDLLQKYSCSNNDPRLGPTAARWQDISALVPKTEPTVACADSNTPGQPDEKYLFGPSEVTGSQITDASFGQQTNQQGVVTGGYEVNLTFNQSGAKEFAKVTARLNTLKGTQNLFGIIVDGRAISVPSNTNGPITGGKAQITGNFTEASAKTLANQLKFGALPFSFKELTSSQISPQLGSNQLKDGVIAGIIGLFLVVLYSLAQYRLLGLVTIASLVVSGIITYAAVTLLGYTSGLRLTMAGVTGLIVAIGITADSFIVYFERVRDEVRSGRPLRAAVQTGWSRAKRTVLISDTVNFLAAAVLYLLSEDNVKAFAFTLGLTTLIDIGVVFFFTHPVLTLLSRTSFFGNGHKWSGFDPERLGARGVTYAGRGRVTIAERKAAAAAGSEA